MNSFVTVDCRSGEISAICVIYDCSCSERVARLGEERGKEGERKRERERLVLLHTNFNELFVVRQVL